MKVPGGTSGTEIIMNDGKLFFLSFFISNASRLSGNKWKTSDVTNEHIIIIHFSLASFFFYFSHKRLTWNLLLNNVTDVCVTVVEVKLET